MSEEKSAVLENLDPAADPAPAPAPADPAAGGAAAAAESPTADSVAKLISDKLAEAVAAKTAPAPKAPAVDEKGDKGKSADEPAPSADADLRKEVEALKAQLAGKELKDAALAKLEADSLPSGLAALLDYSSEESMAKSYAALTTRFIAEKEKAVKALLSGPTPVGLGSGSNEKAVLAEQIRKGIRGE